MVLTLKRPIVCGILKITKASSKDLDKPGHHCTKAKGSTAGPELKLIQACTDPEGFSSEGVQLFFLFLGD